MNLVGEKVTNEKYGVGTITSIEGSYMTVQFPEKVSKFKYPDAFQKHIILDNKSLQDEMLIVATASVDKKEKEKEKAKIQTYQKFKQSVEAAKNPPKKETPGKTATPRKEISSDKQEETVKWDPDKRRTYYCFQGGSFEDEFAGGYIWAPYESQYGMKFHYWDRLKDLKEGDMIFHADHGRIRAISIVKEPCIIAARPVELVGKYADDNHGRFYAYNYSCLND